MMESETTKDSLHPQIWGRVVTQDGGQEGLSYLHYVSQDSSLFQNNPGLGYLSVIAQGLNKMDSRRLFSGIFKSFYQARCDTPLQALQQVVTYISGVSFPHPEVMLLAVLQNDRLYLAQLGHGRGYLIRQNVIYSLLGDQTGTYPDFYRPIVLEAGDRILLCNIELQSHFDRWDTQKRLAAFTDFEFLDSERGLSQGTDISLISATIVPTSGPKTSRWRLSRWQLAIWVVLSLVALLQFAALLLLRWQ